MLMRLGCRYRYRLGKEHESAVATNARAPVEFAVGAIVLFVRCPSRVLLLKLAEQLVHQRVRDAVRVVLVGDDAAGEAVAAHVEVHAVALSVGGEHRHVRAGHGYYDRASGVHTLRWYSRTASPSPDWVGATH